LGKSSCTAQGRNSRHRQFNGGGAMNSKAKTLEVARLSIDNFLVRNFKRGGTYWWVFTEPGRKEGESLWTKDEAEAHLDCFRDYCRRHGIEFLVIWELQQRGSWHANCLVNRRLDVIWLRAWMVERGWGQQMRVEWVTCRPSFEPGKGWTSDMRPARRLASYLTKYLTKSLTGVVGASRKKVFGGSASAKSGTTAFKWMPEIRAGA